MNSARRLLLPAAWLLLLLPVAAASGGESQNFDPRIDGMLRRAWLREAPTAEDQRAAERALRDWDLSEQNAPHGDPRIRELLLTLTQGEKPDPMMARLALNLREDYLTLRGRAQRAAGLGDAPGNPAAPFIPEPPGTQEEIPSADYWFMMIACLLIMAGGVGVWAVSSRKRRAGNRTYYS